MSGIFESIRSQVEDVLFQWNQKEKEYLNVIQEIKDENENLRVSLAETKQELEFIIKQFDESQANEKKLHNEIQKLGGRTSPVSSRSRWRFFR